MQDRAARILKHAHVLVDYSANVQQGETVAIASSTLAIPLVEAIYARVLERGGFPTPFLTPPRLEEILLRTANDDQLRRPPFHYEVGIDYFDHIITAGAPENTRSAGGTDPRRQQLMAEGRAALSAKLMAKMMRPERSVTVTLHPTPAMAQDASMSLLDYEDFFYHACMLDEPDPVARWAEIGRRQARICDWLQSKSTLHIQGPNIDLAVAIGGRRWANGDGRKNFPCGEIFTSPTEDSAEGHVRFTYPAFYQGRSATGVELWLEHGRVIRAEAATGNDFLQAMLDTDDGARKLGEVAIGTNPYVTRFTGNTLFDEKIGGSCHLAIGRGFPDLGGRNASAIHWDMVCDVHTGSAMSADGEIFYRDGEFTLV